MVIFTLMSCDTIFLIGAIESSKNKIHLGLLLSTLIIIGLITFLVFFIETGVLLIPYLGYKLWNCLIAYGCLQEIEMSRRLNTIRVDWVQ